jgi:hypothetical protein
LENPHHADDLTEEVNQDDLATEEGRIFASIYLSKSSDSPVSETVFGHRICDQKDYEPKDDAQIITDHLKTQTSQPYESNLIDNMSHHYSPENSKL